MKNIPNFGKLSDDEQVDNLDKPSVTGSAEITLEDLKMKLYDFGTPQIVREGEVFSVLITGTGLSKWGKVSKIQDLILQYAGGKYPLIEAMKNGNDFFCLILRAKVQTDDQKLFFPDRLHSDSENLLKTVFEELRLKMISNQKKHGWSNEWLTDNWEDECLSQLRKHVDKGDPRDVAIYAMFMIYRGWSTTPF
jgi:hypothetical protein